MQKFTFNNPQQLALSSIENRLKIAFRDVLFQYSNSETTLFDSEDAVISSVGSIVTATISESEPKIYEIEKFLNELLAPNYIRLLLEFGKHFKAIEGATIVETPPSSVSIYINNKPAAALRLWLNSENRPHEIEIIPFRTEEGDLLGEWVTRNQRDILKTNIYVAGDLVRIVTIL